MKQLWMFHAIQQQLADFENQICKTATSKQKHRDFAMDVLMTRISL